MIFLFIIAGAVKYKKKCKFFYHRFRFHTDKRAAGRAGKALHAYVVDYSK